MMSGKPRTEYKFSHVTTGRYLPTPGKAPGWPFAEIGHWIIDVNASSDDWIAERVDASYLTNADHIARWAERIARYSFGAEALELLRNATPADGSAV